MIKSRAVVRLHAETHRVPTAKNPVRERGNEVEMCETIDTRWRIKMTCRGVNAEKTWKKSDSGKYRSTFGEKRTILPGKSIDTVRPAGRQAKTRIRKKNVVRETEEIGKQKLVEKIR